MWINGGTSKSSDLPCFLCWNLGKTIGPGCSSSMGLLMELGLLFISFEIEKTNLWIIPSLGPCNIDMSNSSANGTTWNPHSWNNEANVFFLDQPWVYTSVIVTWILTRTHLSVGVGFSYADFGETVDNTLDAAKNVHAFITIFFETFSQFKGRPLHLSGESYGVSCYAFCVFKSIPHYVVQRATIYLFLPVK